MAGNAHLTEDRIDWTLTLNSNEAEQKLHSLTKETQQLKDRQKELNQELKQAQVHPIKNAKQIELLKEQLKECSSSIKSNKDEMKKLDRQMGVSNLSMSQLRRHASDLKKALDNISQSYHPEEWNKINAELRETRNRIRELDEESASFKRKDAIIATTLGNLLSTTITSITGKMKELIAAGVDMAESADGVQRAFDKLNKPGLLDNLRAATKGTVNDLQLMQAAVRAKDFRIPLEDLGKYLAYAQLKAQETGQSVEYMTDSIIMGLGRQSKQILDDLGLSASEISEEVAKTGDFITGVTAIVDRQLAESGEAYVSAADRSAAATTNLENAQLRLGQAMLPVKEALDDIRSAGASVLAFLIKNKEITWAATTALLAYAAAHVKLRASATITNTVGKIFNTVMATGKTVIEATRLALIKLNIIEGDVIVTTKALKAAWMTNPIGIVITALATAASAFIAFRHRADEATESLTAMDRVAQRMSEKTDDRISKAKELTAIIHDETQAQTARKEALVDLRHIIPHYLGELSEEGKLINDNTSAIENYINALNQEAEVIAISEELQEAYRRKAQYELQHNKLLPKFKSNKWTKKDWEADAEAKRGMAEAQSDIDLLQAKLKTLKETSTAEDAVSTSLIDSLKKRRKEVELWSEATEEQIATKNRELEKIDDEIQRLNNLGKTVKDTTNITVVNSFHLLYL